MAEPRFKRVCRHCHKLFIPDRRNRHRQFYCRKPACRKARKVASQRRWLAQNPDHFKQPKHAERVRLWRERRRVRAEQVRPARAGPNTRTPVQKASDPGGDNHGAAVSGTLLQDRFEVLQDSIIRNPFIVGFLRHVFGCHSVDNMEARVRLLIESGVELLSGLPGETGTPEEQT